MPVALNRAAGVDDYMAVWFHGLEADTGYEVQLDFVDSFDSTRRQTAFVRTLREGYPDPYQVPVVETLEETPLIEADVSSVSLVFGQSEDDAATYRIRLVAGACDGGRAKYPYRVAQVSRPDVSSKALHETDPFHVQGQSPGFVLLKCGTSTSPGPWREVAVQASPLYEYPVAYREEEPEPGGGGAGDAVRGTGGACGVQPALADVGGLPVRDRGRRPHSRGAVGTRATGRTAARPTA